LAEEEPLGYVEMIDIMLDIMKRRPVPFTRPPHVKLGVPTSSLKESPTALITGQILRMALVTREDSSEPACVK
jgi:hypothetical protein